MYAVSARNTTAGIRLRVAEITAIGVKSDADRIEELESELEAERQRVAALESELHSKALVADIIAEAAIEYGTTPAAIKGQSRTKRLVVIRHETIWRAHCRRPDLSTTQLGRQFGMRDHTTILYVLRKMEKIYGDRPIRDLTA